MTEEDRRRFGEAGGYGQLAANVRAAVPAPPAPAPAAAPVEALAAEMYHAAWQACRAGGLFVIRWEDLTDLEQPRPHEAATVAGGWLAAARVAQGHIDALTAEQDELRERLGEIGAERNQFALVLEDIRDNGHAHGYGWFQARARTALGGDPGA